MAPRRMAPRRMAQMFGADGCPRDVKPWRMGPPSYGFPFQAHPSVPFVLAFPVPETDVPETEVPETDDPQTDVAETEVPETDVAETDDPQTDVAETDDPQTDGAETDDPETDDPETEVPEKDGADGWRRDGRCALSTLCMVLVAVTVRFA